MNDNSNMNKQKQQYAEYIKQKMPRHNTFLNCVKAFLIGGVICVIGQALGDLGSKALGLGKMSAASFASIVLVFIGATLTGIGVYDKIAKFAGAGSLVPITGFANSIVAPAMEYKREGYILGVSAKLFSIAGPVIVHGVIVSVIIGLIYYFFVV